MTSRTTMLVTLTSLLQWTLPASGQTPEFSKAASGEPELVQEGPERTWCPVCGMHLPTFYKTSHALRTEGQPALQYCSLRCLALDLDRLPAAAQASIQVVDITSERLVDARQATYVVGSDVPGTMSRVSKLAFEMRPAAEIFARAHGGRLATFDEALAAARASLADDRTLLARRRQELLLPAGERIVREHCRASALPHEPPPRLSALKAELKASRACGELSEQSLHQLAVYLWDGWQNRPRPEATSPPERVEVPAEARCPICGMRVRLYPHWAAEARVADGTPVFFDGAKCMFRYHLRHPRAQRFRVTSYYTLTAIEARSAHYVIGSDVLGPMGHELVPFPTREQAETFRLEHRGERILTFDQVDIALLEVLDHRP